MDQTKVFVSYSHADLSLVAPVVKLLQANKSLVFQDINSIQPGKKWRNEIAKGLAESDLVIVFWCNHASHSDEVCKEWQAAIAHEKDLLPLLLDATPLPQELGDFQWIDFRSMVGATHALIVSPQNDPLAMEGVFPARAKSGHRLWFGGLAVVLLAAVTGGFYTFSSRMPGAPMIPPQQRDIDPVPSVISQLYRAVGGNVSLIVLLIAVSGLIVWWLLRRYRKQKTALGDMPAHQPDHSQIAHEIEKEILRRAASRI